MDRGLNRRAKAIAAKSNWWAIIIIALQGVILWQVLVAREAADDAGAQAYDAYTQAQAAAVAAESAREKLGGY